MRIIVSFLFLFFPFLLFADAYDFSLLQGLKNTKGDIYFEMSGYDMGVTSFKGNINQTKTITSLKKKYGIVDIQAEYTDVQLTMPHKIIETKEPLPYNPDARFDGIYYLFQKSPKELTVISFRTLIQRDVIFEQEFVKAFLADSLNAYISDDLKGDSISFAGRTVELGDTCVWRGPHNFSCKGGRISWSEFSSPISAGLHLDARIAAHDGDAFSILSKEYIDIIFEGIPTTAYRVAYESKTCIYPRPVLIVYYVEQEVRGHYLSCIMSNYGNNCDDYELSPLLQLFMSIPVVPDWAYNQLDAPQPETFPEKDPEKLNTRETHFEIRTGLITPLRNLRNIFEAAPMLDFFIFIPVNTKTAISFGLAAALPVKSALFDFDYKNEINQVEIASIIQISVRYRYNHIMRKNWIFSPYFGIGISELNTDWVKAINDDGTKEYHAIDALDLSCGLSLKYKFIGCFAEYHYSTYSNSSNVVNNFGNISLNFGLSVAF
jgi:hypothetical protein